MIIIIILITGISGMCSIGGEEEVDEVVADTIEDTEDRLLGYRNVEYSDGSLENIHINIERFLHYLSSIQGHN